MLRKIKKALREMTASFSVVPEKGVVILEPKKKKKPVITVPNKK